MPEQRDTAGPDLGAIFDLHVASEFETEDLEATMATMVDEPHVTHVPTLAGGVGGAGVRRFYAEHFIGHWPDDVRITHVARTTGAERVVDEMVMHFTHDCVMDTFLPGVAPTGRSVELPVVVVAGFEGDKVASERISGTRLRCWCRSACSTPSPCPCAEGSRRRKCSTRTGRATALSTAPTLRPPPPPRTCRRHSVAPRRECR
jgi:carboxymethylenebutenolidase